MHLEISYRHAVFAFVVIVVALGISLIGAVGAQDAEPPETALPSFGNTPGGRTIGGPGQTKLAGGTSKKVFGFLSRGVTQVRFVCVTGSNMGPGVAALTYKSRIGQTLSEKFAPGDSRVVCGETTAIDVECQGHGTQCRFFWRVDEPK